MDSGLCLNSKSSLNVDCTVEFCLESLVHRIYVDHSSRALYKYIISIFQQLAPGEGTPEEFDQTIFPVQKDRTVGFVERLAINLVKEQLR